MRYGSHFASSSPPARSRLSPVRVRGPLALGLLDDPEDRPRLLTRVREWRAVERRQLEPALARVRGELLARLLDPVLLPHATKHHRFPAACREGPSSGVCEPRL